MNRLPMILKRLSRCICKTIKKENPTENNEDINEVGCEPSKINIKHNYFENFKQYKMNIDTIKTVMAKLDENIAKSEAKIEAALKKERNEFPTEELPKKIQNIVKLTNDDL